LAKHYSRINEKTSLFEIQAALNFMKSEYGEMISILPSMLPHSINVEYLWALLPPGSLIMGKNALGIETIWNFCSHYVEKTTEGIFFFMDAEQIVWDGVKVGNARQLLLIPIFECMKLIQELSYLPLKYHPQHGSIIQSVVERSSRVLQLWQPQFSHLEHRGTGLAEVDNEVQQYAVTAYS
jgi:hypothetical protein